MNGGMRMTGWFDILSLDKLKMQEDKAGLEDALRSTVVLTNHRCQLYLRLMSKEAEASISPQFPVFVF